MVIMEWSTVRVSETQHQLQPSLHQLRVWGYVCKKQYHWNNFLAWWIQVWDIWCLNVLCENTLESECQLVANHVSFEHLRCRKFAASYKKMDSWIWEDGSNMTYSGWAEGQPNNFWFGERCIRSVNTDTHLDTNTWDDHRCWLRSANALACKMSMMDV